MNFDGRVQELANRVGRPVIVFDAEFNVVAFSVHDGETDRARLSIILSRKGSEQAKRLIREHRVDRIEGSVLIPVLDDSPSRVVSSLRYQGHLTGYVSYVPDDDEPPEDRDSPEVQSLRAELGANLAARDAERREGSERLLQLTRHLMEGDSSERESAARELVESGRISPAKVYAAMVFRVGEADRTRSAAMSLLIIERALARISSITSRTSLGTVIDDEGVLIIPHEVNPARLQSLIGGFPFPDARGGGGSPRAELIEVHESRREARIALQATICDPQRYGSTAIWESLGLDRLLLQLPLGQQTMLDLPEGVQRLLTISSGADLAATLESYLDNGADAQRTARVLHIHRSTLYYRLDRIRAIIDADLADGRVRRELHTGLRVASLAGLR